MEDRDQNGDNIWKVLLPAQEVLERFMKDGVEQRPAQEVSEGTLTPRGIRGSERRRRQIDRQIQLDFITYIMYCTVHRSQEEP